MNYDTYTDTYKHLVENRVYDNFYLIQGVFTNQIDINLIINSLLYSKKINGDKIIEIELLGGKIKEGKVGSFGFRNSNFFINVSSKWQNLVATQENEKWLNSITKQLINRADGVYLGFPITFTDIPHTNKIYYSNSHNKLKEIKNKYDPENVLSYSGTL